MAHTNIPSPTDESTPLLSSSTRFCKFPSSSSADKKQSCRQSDCKTACKYQGVAMGRRPLCELLPSQAHGGCAIPLDRKGSVHRGLVRGRGRPLARKGSIVVVKPGQQGGCSGGGYGSICASYEEETRLEARRGDGEERDGAESGWRSRLCEWGYKLGEGLLVVLFILIILEQVFGWVAAIRASGL